MKEEEEEEMSFAWRCFLYGFKAYEIDTENDVDDL